MRTVAAQRRENYLQIKQTRERREKKSQNWYTKIEQQFNVLFMQIDFGNFLTLTQILFVVCVHFWWLWPVFLMPELLLKLLFYCWPLHSIFFFHFGCMEINQSGRDHFFLCFSAKPVWSSFFCSWFKHAFPLGFNIFENQTGKQIMLHCAVKHKFKESTKRLLNLYGNII